MLVSYLPLRARLFIPENALAAGSSERSTAIDLILLNNLLDHESARRVHWFASTATTQMRRRAC
jgi:hypothetical protein